MGFLHNVKNTFFDITCKARSCRRRLILCAVISLVGFGLGIALFYISNYGWWYYNRCNFASRIINMGFGLFLSYLAECVVIYVLLALCNMTRVTHCFAYVIDLLACLYGGATMAAVFVYSVMWGILYLLLIAIVWAAVVCVACFLCVCEPPICRSFCESIRDMNLALFALAVGFVYKIAALFVVIKILTALI